MIPTHHPSDDYLIAYAAGSLEEPLSLVVATHLALCPRCRKEVERLEALGGVLLEDEAAAETATDERALDSVLSRLDAPAPIAPGPIAPGPIATGPIATAPKPRQAAPGDLRVPAPLRDYLGGGLEQLDWKAHKGFDEAELLSDAPGFRTRLMRIKSGTAMPAHTHRGNELTLVLTGGFSDEHGHFLRGDLAEADASVKHQPIADPGEDCICLAVTDAPLRLTGPVGRLLNPFLRI